MHAWAQSTQRVQIKGRILDKETHSPLIGATIACTHQPDSIKIPLQFSDQSGTFIFDSIPNGNYILHITFVGYQSTAQYIKISIDEKKIDLGNISLPKTGLTLNQVDIIHKKNPLVVRKDTLEFSASAFNPKQTDLVEDLFKKIPGIQIDKNGVIRINGEIIKSIMINGHPVFGGEDLKTLSKNMQADLIEKIQVIDQKNNTIRSGISNNTNTKIINLTIKKDKQSIVNGQLSLAYGTAKRGGTKANLSQFNPKNQIIFLGNGDNINGLLDGNTLSNTPAAKKWNSGLSYNKDINKALTLNASYMMDYTNQLEVQNSTRETFNIDSNYHYNQQLENNTRNGEHRIYASLEYKIDSLQKINLITQCGFSQSNIQQENMYESIGLHQQTLNSGRMKNTNKNNTNTISTVLQFDKKFAKQGRSLSSAIGYGRSISSETAFNSSYSNFQQTSGEHILDTINQHKLIENESNQVYFTVSYTEPISKKGSLTFTYSEEQISQPFTRHVFNYDNDTKIYDLLNDSLSSSLKYTNTKRFGKTSWNNQIGKLEYTISVGLYFSKMSNFKATKNDDVTLRASDFLPNMTLTYSLSNYKNIKLGYVRNVQFPEIKDLQPIIDNSDPLFIKIGNAHLKPANLETLSFSYNSINPTTMQFISIILNGRFINNNIINEVRIDSIGRQTTQPINMSGAYNFSININSNIPITKTNGTIEFNTVAAINKDISYTNMITGSYKNTSLNQLVKYNYLQNQKFDASTYLNISYNNVKYSSELVNSNNNYSYYRYNIGLEGNISLPFEIIIGASITHEWIKGDLSGLNTKNTILNTSISKSLFEKKCIIKMQAFDLLNQNKGMTRNIGPNYIEDSRNNVLQQFILLKLSYFFEKK